MLRRALHRPVAGRLRSLCSAATVRAEHNRFYDRRDTNFVLHELEKMPSEDAAAIIDSCEAFVNQWAHVDPFLDRNPPKMVPGAETSDGLAAVTSPKEMHTLIDGVHVHTPKLARNLPNLNPLERKLL